MIIFFIAGWAGALFLAYLMAAEWRGWDLPEWLEGHLDEWGPWWGTGTAISWFAWGNCAAYSLFSA